MKQLYFLSHSPKETIDFAKQLSRFLKKGDVVGLVGELGSGKTTFIKGLAQGLGIRKKVNSPSFVILKIYFKKIPFYHFDLYRLKSLKELEDIGFQYFISNSGICVIEWLDKAKNLLPRSYLKIEIQIKKENLRTIKFIAYGTKYRIIINKMKSISKCIRNCD